MKMVSREQKCKISVKSEGCHDWGRTGVDLNGEKLK